MSRTPSRTRLARRAHEDALRDMMRAGLTPHSLLLDRMGASPRGLKRLQATGKLSAPQAERRP